MDLQQPTHILANYYDLESLFESNPQNAIKECQNIICEFSNFKSYEEFLAYHHDHSHVSTCQNGWQSSRMSIHCFDCSTSFSSCICLKCFLNGNHQGHNYSICPSSVGNCDCGDSSQWKPSGFCKNHHGLADDSCPEDYLDEELRNTLTDFVFKAALSALSKLDKTQDQFASEIFQFISSFLQFGDGFRRLIAISLTEKIDFQNLLCNVNKYSSQFNDLLRQLCTNLMNDQIFKQNFSKVTYSIFFDFYENQEDEIKKSWIDFFNHSFSPKPIQYNISHNNWNWIDFWLKICSECKEYFNYLGDEDFSKTFPEIIFIIINSFAYATSFQPNEQTQQFFDRLFSEVLNCGTSKSPRSDNTIIPVSFKGSTEKSYYLSVQSFYLAFYNIFSGFKFKKNLKFDVLFEQLKKHTDISPIYKLNNDENENQKENDKFISKYLIKDEYVKHDNNDEINDSDSAIMYPYIYYESFHNGASFFFSLPLYESLVYILGLENICRIKTARMLLDENNQQLRVKLGIITLKKILSFICLSQSLTPMNFGLIRMIDLEIENPNVATFGLPRYLPVFQLLIGLQCKSEKEEFSLKDFFAFEMAREIGIFDDFTSDDYKDDNLKEIQEKMAFSFLYLSLLLVIDRILFNFESNNFIREQLVFALKKGVTYLNELSQFYDKRVLDDFENPINFDNVLFEIATIKTGGRTEMEESSDKETDKDISFCLKENIKWNPISAINPIMEQKSMLNKEISKHPDQLINIQEFEPEESYFFNTSLFSSSSLTTKTYNNRNVEFDKEKANYDGLKIRLNEFLLTPSVLGVIYHSMRSNESQVNLNDHLSLNILIIISKFLRAKENNNNNELVFNESIDYNSVSDLVLKLRKIVFKYSVDNDENASIENTIVSFNNFVSLLNLKISYQSSKPMSFIDVILEKGEVGKNALNLMDINLNTSDSEGNNENNKEKMIKKQRANKIKEDIMNKYKNIILSYKMSDHHHTDSTNSMETTDSTESFNSPTCSGIINGVTEVCSVCSTNKKNEVLSYPIFFYQTKFPFIFDKPPLLTGRANEISVSCDDDVDYDTEYDDEQSSSQEISESNPESSESVREMSNQESNNDLNNNNNQESNNENQENNNNSQESNNNNQESNNENQENNNNSQESNNNNQEDNNENQEGNNENQENADNDSSSFQGLSGNQSSSVLENSETQAGGSNDFRHFDENSEAEQLVELARRAEYVTNMMQQFIAARSSGLLNQEEFGHAIVAFQQALQEIKVTQEIIERGIFIRNLNKKKRELHEQHRAQRLEEMANHITKPKRYTAGANFVIQFSLCQHLMHSKCAESEVFHCPIDRTAKNGFLPCFDSIEQGEPLSPQMINSIDVFLDGFRRNIIQIPFRKVDVFVELIKSLSGLIATFEVRLRSLPACLDSNNTKILARNLFLTTWHAYRIKNKPQMTDVKPYNTKSQFKDLFGSKENIESEIDDVKTRLTVFQRFMMKLIECDEINTLSSESFSQIVGSFVKEIVQNERSERIEKELFLFLRRVCLTEKFLLGKDVTPKDEDDNYNNFTMSRDYIDWDDILSLNNLSKRFGVTFSLLNGEFEFKPFIPSKLPKEFLHFALEPYNFPIEMTSDFTFYNLFDYNFLIDNYDEFGETSSESTVQMSQTYAEKDVRVGLALNHNMKHYPSALLLVGKFASRILVICGSYTTTLKPFYLDKYGSPDFGFSRGKPLFLNEERLEKFIDEILSGDFTNYI